MSSLLHRMGRLPIPILILRRKPRSFQDAEMKPSIVDSQQCAEKPISWSSQADKSLDFI